MFAALLRCIEPSLDVAVFTFDTPLSRCCVCLLIGGFFVNPDTGIQDDSLGGCTRDLLYLPAESQKRGGNYSNNGRHSKHCRVCTKGQRPTLCPNSQVLDKPWLDFSRDVVPSRRFGPRNWERPRHLLDGWLRPCVFRDASGIHRRLKDMIHGTRFCRRWMHMS